MPSIGLSMIVKNEAHALSSCLHSVAGVVRQIVIADTGSTDGTAEIARKFGATIISVPWDNHFANARNAGLQAMQTDWVLVLDADEELDSDAGTLLPHLLQDSKAGGYLVPIRNYIPTVTGRGWDRSAEKNLSHHPRAQTAPAYFLHENCRLFRRDPEVYFTGRVHELVEPRIQALNRQVLMAPFCIHHFGQLAAEESRNAKAVHYRDLLRLKIQELPGDSMAWVQLGLQEYECSRDPSEPLRCFERAIALEPEKTPAHLFKAMVYLDCGMNDQALAALDASHPDKRSRALREHLRGDALHNLGRLAEARTAYSDAARATGNDPVIGSKLGYTEVRLGRTREGLAKLRQAAEKAPDVAEIRERLMKAFVAVNALSEAADHAEKLAALEGTAKAYLRAGSLRVHARQSGQAKEILERGRSLFPDSTEIRRAIAEIMGEGGGTQKSAAQTV
jgi:tetratricopeptide (TPR) repeat protein